MKQTKPAAKSVRSVANAAAKPAPPQILASPTVAERTKPAGPRSTTVRLELFAPEAKTVFIAGSFNDWRPDATAMKLTQGGRWAQELVLPPGKYEYLFQVDGQWTPDPQARGYVANPFGGRNSLLEIP